MKAARLALSMAMLLASMPSAPVQAAAPAMFNYQGKLSDASGAPRNSPVSMAFRIYDAASGGTLRVTYTPSSAVSVTNGVFSVLVGDTTAGTVTAGSDANLTAALSTAGAR